MNEYAALAHPAWRELWSEDGKGRTRSSSRGGDRAPKKVCVAKMVDVVHGTAMCGGEWM